MGVDGLNLDTMILKARERKLFYTGLWPLYWATHIPPLTDGDQNFGTKYFVGRKRLVAYIVALKLKYPDLIIEKY